MLVFRSALILAIFAAYGAAPASYLDQKTSTRVAIGVAPVLGACVATALFTDLIWLFPAEKSKWLLPIGALLSIALGWRNYRHRGIRVTRHMPQMLALCGELAVVALFVAAPTAQMMLQRHSTGPVAYQVADSGGYVFETDGMIHESMRQAVTTLKGPWSDLVQAYWSGYSYSNLEAAIDPVSANLDALLGIGATSTQSASLIAMLVCGGLGLWAVVRHMLNRRSLLALIAGGLFGGAFFMQLFFDGSEGAICGLALVAPMALLGLLAIERPSRGNLALVALALSGAIALYPLFLPAEVVTGLGVLVVLGLRRPRTTRLAPLARAAKAISAVVVFTIIFEPVATYRTARYLLHVGSYVRGQPNYSLPTISLVSWLTQLRGFYELSFSAHTNFANVALALAAPIAVIAVAVLPAARQRLGSILALFVVVCVVIAFIDRARVSNGGMACTYCEDRALLPVVPAVIVLFCVGLATLLAWTSWSQRIASGAIGLFVLAGVSYAADTARQRFLSSYFLPNTVGSALSHLPKNATVELEGFDEAAPNPIAELMLTYARADESDWKHVSITADFDENNSLLYFGNLGEKQLTIPNPQFHAPYGFVLTRVAGVENERRTLYRSGSIALQEIVTPPDVLIDHGFSVLEPLSDSTPAKPVANTWVNEVMQLVVTGSARAPSYVRLWFDLPSWLYTTPVYSHQLVHVWNGPHQVSVCLRTTGRGNDQIVRLRFRPGTGPQLVRTAASSSACPG